MQTTTKIATRLGVTVAATALLLLAAPAMADAAESSGPSPDVTPLAKYAGYGLPNGSHRVRALQRHLHAAGERPGPVDGRFGPLTEAAVLRFQNHHGLEADGIVGPKTGAALRHAAKVLAPGAGYRARHGSTRVRKLQRSLERLGDNPGPVDGRFGPRTEAAVIRFQRDHGLTADGLVGPVTTAGLERQLARATRVSNRSSSDRQHNPNGPTVKTSGTPAIERTQAASSHDSISAFGATTMFLIGTGLVLGAAAALALASRRRTTRPPQPKKPHPVRLRAVREGLVVAPAASSGDNPGHASGPPMLGYASVAPGARGRDRQELRAQLQAIVSECRRRGLVLVDVIREREPERGKGLQRPALGYALRRIADGEASGLVVAELSRVSRSVTDLGEVLEWFSRSGARLVAVSPALDTADESGALAARTLIDVSSWERERLSERTRRGLEAARREGRRGGRAGVADNPKLSEQIAAMRAEGMTLQAIADRLNEEGVPTIRGGALWRPSSVQAAVGYRRPQRSEPWRGAAEHDHEVRQKEA